MLRSLRSGVRALGGAKVGGSARAVSALDVRCG